MQYGKQRPGAVPGRRRSNRQSVEWVPVTQLAYGQAIVAADALGIDLAVWVDEAIMGHLARTEHELREARYREACQAAMGRIGPMPTRREILGPDQEQPFVRPAPEASGRGSAGRPSSRRDQNGTGAQPGSKAAKPGPERPGATRSAASMARTREDPPFDAGEHRGPQLAEDPCGSPHRKHNRSL